MTGRDLIFGMSFIDERFVDEAEAESLRLMSAVDTRRRSRLRVQQKIVKTLATAAALVLIVGAGVLLQQVIVPRYGNGLLGSPVKKPDLEYDEEGFTADKLTGDSGNPALGVETIQGESKPQDGRRNGLTNVRPESAEEEDSLGIFEPVAENAQEPEAGVVDGIIEEMPVVDLDSIALNELEKWNTDALRMFDAALYDFVRWDEEDVASYFGRDIRPAYLPKGLTAPPVSVEDMTEVVFDTDGNLVYDVISYEFTRGRAEESSLPSAQTKWDLPGFSITASRMEQAPFGSVYLLPDEDRTVSRIGVYEVLFGYRKMAGEGQEADEDAYLYTAVFMKDGVSYEIAAWQMELEELVRMTASVLYETASVNVE